MIMSMIMMTTTLSLSPRSLQAKPGYSARYPTQEEIETLIAEPILFRWQVLFPLTAHTCTLPSDTHTRRRTAHTHGLQFVNWPRLTGFDCTRADQQKDRHKHTYAPCSACLTGCLFTSVVHRRDLRLDAVRKRAGRRL